MYFYVVINIDIREQNINYCAKCQLAILIFVVICNHNINVTFITSGVLEHKWEQGSSSYINLRIVVRLYQCLPIILVVHDVWTSTPLF